MVASQLVLEWVAKSALEYELVLVEEHYLDRRALMVQVTVDLKGWRCPCPHETVPPLRASSPLARHG
jgi:hypothetical protein